MTAQANQTTGLTNGRAANWVSEVAFSPFRALSHRHLTFPFVAKSAYYSLEKRLVFQAKY